MGGAEGSEFPGLALWPDDPARRLEVFFGEDGKQAVSFVLLGDKEAWGVAGLKLGDPLARVREANAKPFTFWGFDWDYGGYADLSGGRLKALPGGCTLSLRFDALDAAEIPEEFVGDREVSSDNPRIGTLDARLSELGVGFPDG